MAENLAWSCLGCNERKSDFVDATDPATGVIEPLYNPRSHQWADHFEWDASATLLVGLSPIGRATVERLQLNRPGVTAMRRLLLSCGLHPPEQRLPGSG